MSRVLALEAADSTTVFIRADALAERVARVQPQAIPPDGALDLAPPPARRGHARGGRVAGDRSQRARDRPGRRAGRGARRSGQGARRPARRSGGDWAVAGASWLGAKALMAAVESRLAGERAFTTGAERRWSRATIATKNDARLAELAVAAKPALVFIHGTGSSTWGVFGDLPGALRRGKLTARFEEHIFGFEHRTFSESPIDNALTLLDVVPAEAHISLVTHSRAAGWLAICCAWTRTAM